MIRKLLALLVVSATAVFLSGCQEDHTIGGTIPTTIYHRGVSLSPSSTEVVMLTRFVELVGRTQSCDYPANVAGAEVVMKGIKPNYERILQIHPDAVFYDGAIISDADLQKFKDANIPTVETGGGDTVEAFEKNLMVIAPLIKGEPGFSAYVDKIQKSINAAKSSSLEPKPKVAILLPGEGAEHMICGQDSFAASLVKNSGGEPVGPAGNQFVTLNAESFIKMNPDVIIVAGVLDSVIHDARFAGMSAMQKHRIQGFAPALLLRKGQRIDATIKNLSGMILTLMKKG